MGSRGLVGSCDGSEAPLPLGRRSGIQRAANVDQLAFGTAPVGAYPRNVSPIGCYGMIGDVWEWTSSDFRPWPGFEAFPYPGIFRSVLR